MAVLPELLADVVSAPLDQHKPILPPKVTSSVCFLVKFFTSELTEQIVSHHRAITCGTAGGIVPHTIQLFYLLCRILAFSLPQLNVKFSRAETTSFLFYILHTYNSLFSSGTYL